MASATEAPAMLRVGSKSVPLSTPAAEVASLVDASNREHRIDGVPDELNPAIIDPVKAAGFVAALPSQPANVLAKLAGHSLWLNWADLGLQATAPTRREAFAAHVELVIDNANLKQVAAHTSIPFDSQLARAKATEAQSALARDEATANLESQGQTTLDARDSTRRRRSALAQAWLNNATVWAKAEPANSVAQSSLAAASKAYQTYGMPRGVY